MTKEEKDDIPWIVRDLHAELRKNSTQIPESIQQFYLHDKIENYSFRGELYYLRKRLLTERFKNYPKEKEFYRLLFIALADFYLGAYKYALEFLNMALELNVGQHLYPLIIQIKYQIIKLKRTLFIVSYESKVAYNFIRLEEINPHITVETIEEYENMEGMLTRWMKYDQVFLLGHGDEDEFGSNGYIQIGNTEFTPKDLQKFYLDFNNKPKVIGIFSCGNGFGDIEICNNIDYFMTDTFISVPEYVEMFFNGYLTEYFYSRNIHSAYQKGKMATLFRAISNPGFVLKVRGTTFEG